MRSVGRQRPAVGRRRLARLAGAEVLLPPAGHGDVLRPNLADLEQVRSCLEENSVPMQHSGIIWNPQSRIALEDTQKAEQVIRLIEMLEDDDDVQQVYSNFDISEEVATQLAS